MLNEQTRLIANNCLFDGNLMKVDSLVIRASSSLIIISNSYFKQYNVSHMVAIRNCTFEAYMVYFVDITSKMAGSLIQATDRSKLNLIKCHFMNISLMSDSISKIEHSIITIGGDSNLMMTACFISENRHLGIIFGLGNGSITLEGVIFINNWDCALFNVQFSFVVIVNNLTFANNTLELFESFCTITGGQFLLTNSIVQNNTAGGVGVFIHYSDGNLTIVDCIFSNNSNNSAIRTMGGVIAMFSHTYSTSLRVINSTFMNNQARTSGAVMYISSEQIPGIDVVIDSCIFSMNTALFDSGIYLVFQSLVHLSNVTFITNKQLHSIYMVVSSDKMVTS